MIIAGVAIGVYPTVSGVSRQQLALIGAGRHGWCSTLVEAWWCVTGSRETKASLKPCVTAKTQPCMRGFDTARCGSARMTAGLNTHARTRL
jgi:hypothetical protein